MVDQAGARTQTPPTEEGKNEKSKMEGKLWERRVTGV